MAVSRPTTAVPRHRHRRVAPAHPRVRLRSLRSLLRPRDWRVRTKLGAVLVVPAVAFVAVAGLQTSTSVRQAATLSELAGQVALGGQVTALVHELQFERDRVSGLLAVVTARPVAERDRGQLAELLATAQVATGAARTAFDEEVAPLRDRPGLRPVVTDATAALDELAVVHSGIEEGWLSRQAVFDGYTRAIEALLALLPVPSGADDEPVRAYQDLAEVKEISARIRGQVFAMVSAGAVEPGASELLADTRAQRRAAQDRFRANATAAQLARFDEVVRGQAVRGSARLERAVLEQAATGEVDLDPDQWWSAATTELELIREVEGALLADVREQVAQASQRQWRQTGLVSAATLLILLASLLTSVGIGRSMARSLRQLREQAMDVAQAELPGLLARLRGSRGAVPAVDEVAPLTAGGGDEVGDVADAFTQVHRSAVELAVEQAVMRRNVNSIFVNLARRSQVLVERQLELLDDLERDEAEPGQLRSLFRLDHLATRMRRNNESLLVLTDGDSTRRYGRPVPLAAVTVAAIAEIEHYQRVREEVAADLHVVGHAATDLVHLLAELLDNATSFSAGDTTVVITGQRQLPQPARHPHLDQPAGALVEITDSGLGMSRAAMEEANALLAAPPAIDVAASERMGLVVVSHLAARHGVRVRLASLTRGVRASVWLSAAVLAAPPVDAGPVPVHAEPVGDSAGRRAVRAEDVLAGASEQVPSTWWDGAPAGGTATLLAPAPAPVVAGVSAGGLPIRVPLAQLPGPPEPDRRPAGGAWRADDPDPDQVGTTLSRLYSGLRRAESETVELPEAKPREEKQREPGGVGGEPEQGST